MVLKLILKNNNARDLLLCRANLDGIDLVTLKVIIINFGWP